MNDLLFAIVAQNLRPDLDGERTPWFVFVPNTVRIWAAEHVAPEIMSRAVFAATFVGILLGLCIRLSRQPTPHRLAESIYFALTWFWLCGPTGNPWYLLWGLPLLPFVCFGPWRLLAPLAMIYYFRFWLDEVLPGPGGPLGWTGVEYFDYGVVFLELGPLLLLAAWCGLCRSQRGCASFPPLWGRRNQSGVFPESL
jgi:hypothetical protein